MDNNDEILDEFLLEALEIFDQLDLDFVKLEQTPTDKKLIGSIFRAMHTLKGSSGFFAFHRLEKVAHSGESLLSNARDGALLLNGSLISLLLETSDRLREIIEGIRQTRSESEGDDTALLKLLEEAISGQVPSERDLDAIADAPIAPPVLIAIDAAGDSVSAVESKVVLTLDSATTAVSAQISTQVPESESSENLEEDANSQIENRSLDLPNLTNPINPGKTKTQAAKSTEIVQPVKVSVELLDTLMNLVSEMVLARNRLLSFATNSTDVNFSSMVRTIDIITLELQERMMKTRMQPISQVWTKFPRLVRDIAQETKKTVDLIQIGSETELDRTLLDSIRDPLVHIIRNSVDHGIELPEVRRANGKNPTGTITLRSMHENGMVVIEISDDGAGINIPVVAKKAVSKGIITEEKLAKLSEREILDLIFLPGFSTKEQISNLSGRGVGMDVVKTNIQQIGGSVDIATSAKGTTFSLRIPLTLAIMPAVFVRCQSERFAIPQNNLFEMVRHEPREGVAGIENFNGVPVFRLRNKLIPLLVLNNELGFCEGLPDPTQPLNIVVVQAAGIRFGLIVDEVLYMQEVVVKPIGPLLKSVNLYSGATILGDGLVSLIFDISGLAVRSGLVSKLLDQDLDTKESSMQEDDSNLQSMLLFDLVETKRIAIPLDCVERLEFFNGSQIDRRGEDSVIIYNDKIMKLISLPFYLERIPVDIAATDKLSVIVHYHKGEPLGLIVHQIHDIVRLSDVVTRINPPILGILGNTIYHDEVIAILDLPQVLSLSNTISFEEMRDVTPYATHANLIEMED